MKEFLVSVIILYGFVFLLTLPNKAKNKSKRNISRNNISKKQQSNLRKGAIGENIICNLINSNIDIYYKIVRNVYIKNEDKYTEIDIILITSFGIFIIESKNYNGSVIYGKEEDFNWTEFFIRGRKSFRINNPIKQNQYHINFISKYLNKSLDYFKSYIVFGKNIDVSKIQYDKSKNKIINASQVVEHLIDDMHNSDIIFSHEEIDKIYIDLKYYCQHNNYYETK